MSVDRRGFLAGASFLAGGAFPVTQAAALAMRTTGLTIADFGVEAGSAADQTASLQRAIDEITKSGDAVRIPPGRYLTGPLRLPPRCIITGIGAIFVCARPGEPVLEASANEALLTGLTFEGQAQGQPRTQGRALIAIKGGILHISSCHMKRCAAGAIAIENGAGSLRGITVDGSHGPAVLLAQARGFSVTACKVSNAGEGIRTYGASDTDGVVIIGNQVSGCATGIALAGSGVANGNFITGATRMGLQLGSGDAEGRIVATGNNIHDCAVGIGVAAGGETILASLNLITKAREGAIRAFDGPKLLGPDLARESAEAFLNLTVAGNVAR